ncbi:hypothetical protein PWEIH_06401 [Listeria weihenstephanensis FSL R9-0317]|uniref:Uncharacterized protein n=1 Tax=Listeria weihenstephanensis TaxID=1006155 RepID=A0A1S7FRI8_9LIST|nr:hypothetical protein [Listeria weihenstephanensis]AQY49955.1 hypothetical protein UE46_02100 [Listeria weihenstephanensis]EUJ39696.1 hypothetical protein PWEIH_06401 [Listeria weihenstephanensis FSL R9-0317]MBC1499691.1 hypothetical protein [Listeria weihenstephanensis]
MSNLMNLFTGPVVAHEIKIENKTRHTIVDTYLVSGNQRKRGNDFRIGEKRSLYLPASNSKACELSFTISGEEYHFPLREKIDTNNQAPIVVNIVTDGTASLDVETYREQQESNGKIAWKDSNIIWGTATFFFAFLIIWIVNIL